MPRTTACARSELFLSPSCLNNAAQHSLRRTAAEPLPLSQTVRHTQPESEHASLSHSSVRSAAQRRTSTSNAFGASSSFQLSTGESS